MLTVFLARKSVSIFGSPGLLADSIFHILKNKMESMSFNVEHGVTHGVVSHSFPCREGFQRRPTLMLC